MGDDVARTVMAGGTAPGTAPGAGPTAQGRRPDWVPALIALVVFAAYSVISISRYVRLDPGSLDLATFTEAVRQYAHLQAPVADIASPGLNLLGDHFHPVLALIAPFFRLFPTPVTLLVAQNLLVALSVIPVSRAATAVLGTTAAGSSQRRTGSPGDCSSWPTSTSTKSPSRCHCWRARCPRWSGAEPGRPRSGRCRWSSSRRTRASPSRPSARSCWQAPGRRTRRERARAERSAAALDRGRARIERRAGIFLIVWGLAWTAATVTVIIPFFNPWHQYDYWAEGGTFGGGGGNSAAAVLSQLAQGGPEKLGTLALLLLPVVFLALRSPLALIGVPALLLRFINTDSAYWGTHYHYNAPLMPIVFIAAVDALARISASPALAAGAGGALPGSRLRAVAAGAARRYAPAAMVVIAIGLACWAPLKQLAAPQTYSDGGPQVQAEKAALAMVPDGVTVEAPYSAAATLGARADAFWVGDPTNPAGQYIVLDTGRATDSFDPRPGNPAQWVAHRHPGISYREIFAKDDIYVFRRE